MFRAGDGAELSISGEFLISFIGNFTELPVRVIIWTLDEFAEQTPDEFNLHAIETRLIRDWTRHRRARHRCVIRSGRRWQSQL